MITPLKATGKVSLKHMEIIRDAIVAVVGTQDRLDYTIQRVLNDPRVKDPSKRFRWDCFWAARIPRESMNELYSNGINDTHIDTALKAIMKHLGWSI